MFVDENEFDPEVNDVVCILMKVLKLLVVVLESDVELKQRPHKNGQLKKT